MPSNPRAIWQKLFPGILLFVLVFTCYWPGFRGEFLWDDDSNIIEACPAFLGRTPPHLVRAARHATILSHHPHHLLARLSPMGIASRCLSFGKHPAPRPQRNSPLAASAKIKNPRRMVRRGPLRVASGQRRNRRLDHRTQKHPFRRFLSQLIARRRELLAAR